MKITLKQIRQCNYCKTGFFTFCEKYKINWRLFTRGGIDSDELLKLCNNDYLAIKAVEFAKKDQGVK